MRRILSAVVALLGMVLASGAGSSGY